MDLKTYLAKNKIKVSELSSKSGVGYSTIYDLLRGRKPPTLRIAEKIQFATNGQVTIADLRGKDEKKKR